MSKQQNTDYSNEDDDDFDNDANVEVIELAHGQTEEDDLANQIVEIEMENEEADEEEESEQGELDTPLSTITKHNGDAFCVANFDNLFATGGEDDLMYLWSFNSDQTDKCDLIMQSEKFNDSVTSLSFSSDGKYLASADMAGNIRVYIIENKSLFWSYEVGSDLETLDWHPSCNVLFCGTSDGQFIMFKLSSNEVKVMYSGNDSSVTCFKILKDGKRAACGYNNGAVRFWDLKTSQTIFNITNAHQDAIMCMDLSPDGNLIATGGVDMKINLINTNTGKSICNLFSGNAPNKKSKDEEVEDEEEIIENSIETLSFCKTMAMLACGTLKGELLVWDLNSQTIRNKLENRDQGFSKVFWSPNDETLFSASLNGCVDIFDGRNLNLIKKVKCHHNEILDMCVNSKLKIFFTVSTDQTVKIFKTD